MHACSELEVLIFSNFIDILTGKEWLEYKLVSWSICAQVEIATILPHKGKYVEV